MELRGIDFGHVLNASGARGFFGEGYWFHEPWKKLGLDYKGSTFVAKTTTLYPRAGNMPLKPGTVTPIERVPSCIIVKPWRGVVLNAVGLSGPGATFLIRKWCAGEIPNKEQPYFVSFMSVAATPMERIQEARIFAGLLAGVRLSMPSPFGVQINMSCPNVGLDTTTLVEEAADMLNQFATLNVPLMLKVNALLPTTAAAEMTSHPACDAIVCSNTIPWGKLPELINWKGIFGTDKSPLSHLGGGGLSGAPLLPIVKEWVRSARFHGVKKPIVAGGGVLSASDALDLIGSGAEAIEIGSVSILRPWRVQKIIRECNYVLGAGKVSK